MVLCQWVPWSTARGSWNASCRIGSRSRTRQRSAMWRNYGGWPVFMIGMGSDGFLLNRDTKRSAVRAFLTAAARAGGADHLRWHVTANARGVINRVSYRPDDEPTPGWYAYLREPSSEPQELR